ncbi:MAG: hypothetical protein RL757_2533 [Bacteroidota bacterium]|jgi:nicotinamide mononucleotide transporter
MEFLEEIAFNIWNYPVSWLELVGTVAGLIAVALAAMNHIWNWGIGLVNVVCFFVIFKKEGLYSDMLLQVYFFITGIYGWYIWSKSARLAKNDAQNGEYTGGGAILSLETKTIVWLSASVVLFTFLMGNFTPKLHVWYPIFFKTATAFPFVDAFATVLSVIANYLLARRFVESWFIWIIVNIVSTYMYFEKNLKLISIEFFIFLIIAIIGAIQWSKMYQQQTKNKSMMPSLDD